MERDSQARVFTFHLTRDGLAVADIPGDSLDEVSRNLPDGTYTTLRTFAGNRFLHLDAHLDRLEESAGVLGRKLKVDRARLKQALADVLLRAGFQEARLRITVPLDAGASPDIAIAVEPLRSIDPELYETGVRAVTMLIARASPRAKATGFIAPSRTLKAGLPPEVYEVLMVTGDGHILEGFTSNFFAITAGRLITAADGILEGVTRSIVLGLAQELLPVDLRSPHLGKIPNFDEAFITSSSRGILPVVSINWHVIGDGRPGPLTRRLRKRYDEYIVAEAKPPL